MPRKSRIAEVENRLTKVEEITRFSSEKAADTNSKLEKFLTNDWVHTQAKILGLDIKLNILMGAFALIAAGIFVPLALKWWDHWFFLETIVK